MTRRFEATQARYEDFRREHPLGEFLVNHREITAELVRDFEACLDSAEAEAPLQKFLESHPHILVQSLGGSARFVLPQARLGAQFVPDFVLGEHYSYGYDWVLVELESPTVPLFTQAGDPRAGLTHAIRQIQEWRAWLQRNQNYASRPRSESGLGLTDITAQATGLIIMGRRELVDSSTNDLRRQMVVDTGIQIRTYDFLLEAAQRAIGGDEPAA